MAERHKTWVPEKNCANQINSSLSITWRHGKSAETKGSKICDRHESRDSQCDIYEGLP